MKTIIRNLLCGVLLLSMTIALSSSSCGGGGKPNHVTPAASSLSVSPATLTLAPNASSTVNVTSNITWTAKAPAGYTVTPASGKGNATVTVKAGASVSGGSLVFSGSGKSATVALQTSAISGDIALSTDKVELTYEGGKSATFKITCNGSWTITLPTSKPTWLASVSPMSGTGDATVTVNTSANPKREKDQTFITIKSGTKSAYLTIYKDPAPNKAPTKPTGLKPSGSAEYLPEISWNASTDGDGDEVKYTVMLSKDKNTWTSLPRTTATKIMPKEPLDKNCTYYMKVVADDTFAGGKVESDVVSFTTTSIKSYWADREVKQYNINSDGSFTEVALGTTPRPVKLIYTGDGYTQDLYKYGGQFDQEMQKGILAFFAYEPYKTYAEYFTVYVVAAYSNEAGMSVGSSWQNPTTVVDTKFKCTWAGGNSTGINCNTATVIDYAAEVPGMRGADALATGTNLTWSPISILINTNQYAGTNIWSSGISNVGSYGGYRIVSIAQTPARHPVGSGYGDSWNTLRHEYGGHGFGLLGDEYVYYSTTSFPQSNEANFRAWQGRGTYCNTYLPEWDETGATWRAGEMEKTPEVAGANWKTFADKPEYAAANIQLFPGSATYGLGVYRSEQGSCMINNIPHFNTISRWKIYCRIMETAGKTPTVEDFMSRDVDKTNTYGSAPTKSSHNHKYCEGPLLMDAEHRRPYRLK